MHWKMESARCRLCYLDFTVFHMMMSSSGNIFRVTGPFCGEITGHQWIPPQRPMTRSFDFFYLRPNKRLSKQSWGWCFETPSHSLWRHCNGHLTTPHQRYDAPLGGIFAGNYEMNAVFAYLNIYHSSIVSLSSLLLWKNIRHLFWNRGAWCSLNSTYQTFLTPCIRCSDHICD